MVRLEGIRRHISGRRGRGNVGIPKGFPKSVGRFSLEKQPFFHLNGRRGEGVAAFRQSDCREQLSPVVRGSAAEDAVDGVKQFASDLGSLV